jgi:hypothetical protein
VNSDVSDRGDLGAVHSLRAALRAGGADRSNALPAVGAAGRSVICRYSACFERGSGRLATSPLGFERTKLLVGQSAICKLVHERRFGGRQTCPTSQELPQPHRLGGRR